MDLSKIKTSNQKIDNEIKPQNSSQDKNETSFETIFMKSIEYYQNTINKAKAENNNSKARRSQRMLDEFNSAFITFKAGKPYPYHELVVAPGLPKIPENPFQIQKR